MRNLKRLRENYNIPNAHLHITCPCNLNTTYTNLAKATDDGVQIQSEVPLNVTCPRCTRVYPAEASYSTEAPKTLELTLTKTDSDGVPIIPDGECPDCQCDIYEENYHEGPEAPETGWEYYRCPDCGTTISPEAFENVTPNQGNHTEST